MDNVEIRIAGFGGQGVILAGMIIGRASAIYEKLNATLIQAFGPEARGSACSAQVMVSSSRIFYPYVTKSNILIAMSQDAYKKFTPELVDGGTLLIEEDLVKVDTKKKKVQVYGIPATRFAEEIGRKLITNIVMVGFFAAVTKLVNPDSMRKSVKESVPKGTEELNLMAFEKGYEFGVDLLKKPS